MTEKQPRRVREEKKTAELDSCAHCEVEWCRQYPVHWYCFKLEKRLNGQ